MLFSYFFSKFCQKNKSFKTFHGTRLPLVNTLTNLRAPQNLKKFLTSEPTSSVSRRFALQGVSYCKPANNVPKALKNCFPLKVHRHIAVSIFATKVLPAISWHPRVHDRGPPTDKLCYRYANFWHVVPANYYWLLLSSWTNQNIKCLSIWTALELDSV
jgi:hypothetical protein